MGCMEIGILPSSVWGMNDDRAFNDSLAPLSAESLVRSLRCYDQRPSGPPADTQGNNLMALVTSFSVAWTKGTGDLGEEEKLESRSAGGYFSLSVDRALCCDRTLSWQCVQHLCSPLPPTLQTLSWPNWSVTRSHVLTENLICDKGTEVQD